MWVSISSLIQTTWLEILDSLILAGAQFAMIVAIEVFTSVVWTEVMSWNDDVLIMTRLHDSNW